MWNHSNGKQYSTSIYELEVYKEFNIENIEILNKYDVISTGETFQLETKISPDVAAHKNLHIQAVMKIFFKWMKLEK